MFKHFHVRDKDALVLIAIGVGLILIGALGPILGRA